MEIVVQSANGPSETDLRNAIEQAIVQERTSIPCPTKHAISIGKPGYYALFAEHHPDEFNAALEGHTPLVAGEFKPDHEHGEEVSSVGITTPGDLDQKKFNRWLNELLQSKGTDIFRMKGILSLQDMSQRFVFQGVHMLFDGKPDRPWDDEPRRNSLIFIGRNLDREALNEGFRKCLA
jgi:G3E family GTPase